MDKIVRLAEIVRDCPMVGMFFICALSLFGFALVFAWQFVCVLYTR